MNEREKMMRKIGKQLRREAQLGALGIVLELLGIFMKVCGANNY